MLFSEPLTAMANNFDMIRVQSCIGAYPVRDASVSLWSNSPDAPIKRYKFQLISSPVPCFLTSETIFAFMAWPFMWAESAIIEDGTFSVRWVGAVKLATLVLLTSFFTLIWLQRREFLAALLNVTIVLVVLMDPMNTLYLNGFYAEFAALIFAYAAIAATALATNRKPAIGLVFIIGVAVIGLCLSKAQHALAGLSLTSAVLAVWMLTNRISKILIAGLFVSSIIGLTIQTNQFQTDSDTGYNYLKLVRLSTLTNVVFTYIMPLVNEPLEMTRYLGLPDKCAEYSGINWWQAPINENVSQHPCKEVMSVSHFRILGLIWQQPRSMFRYIAEGLNELRPWLGNKRKDGRVYLGVVEGKISADLPTNWFSLSQTVDRLTNWQFKIFLMVPTLILGLFFIMVRFKSNLIVATTILAMLLFLTWSSYASILFGNGYMDMPKVSSLMKNFILAFWVAIIMIAMNTIVVNLVNWTHQKKQHGSG